MTTRTHFAFRIDMWSPDGSSIVEHVALAGLLPAGAGRWARKVGEAE
jgi:hypothetical protein